MSPPSAQPLVTAVVLSYDNEAYLTETLDSVDGQDHPALEIVVVDDGSHDNSAAVIERWQSRRGRPVVRLFQPENRGICAALNRALEVAQGRYVSAVGSDDRWLPDRVSTMVSLLEGAGPRAGAWAYSDAWVIDEYGRRADGTWMGRYLDAAPRGRVFEELLVGNFIPAASLFLRRDALDEVGLYDEDLAFEDWDMNLRLADRFPVTFCPRIGVEYRRHSASMTADPAWARRRALGELMVLDKWWGRSPETDVIVASRAELLAWRFVRRFGLSTDVDERFVRRVLARVAVHHPTPRRMSKLVAAELGAFSARVGWHRRGAEGEERIA